jgi:CubicO group peptidase (beta-lactamase class C family)
MFVRTLSRARRLRAKLLASLNIPRPPARPATVDGDWEYLKSQLRWLIRRTMGTSGTPGVSIALVDDQQLLWAEGFGWADRERRVAASADTVYQIGSITKLLNAVAMLQLVDQGRLALDRPLTDYLPEFRMHSRWPQAAPITPRALLSHHGGLPTYYLKGFFSDEPLARLLDELREEHLAYEPHTVFNYSNLGPNLLGVVLERLRGAPYAQALGAQLLAPLGMQHTGFAPVGQVRERLARGYVYDQPVEPTPIRDLPAGGLYSSVLDLARFMRMVLGGGTLDGARLVSREALAESLTAQYPDCVLDFGHRYGLGWMLSGLRLENTGPQAWHNGGTKAFLSQLALLPEKKLGVVVLANSDRANALVYETAEEALRLALEIRDGIQAAPRASRTEIPMAREDLARHVGDYSLMGSLARISLGRKRLRLHVLNYKLELVPETPSRFRVEYNLLGLKSVPIPFPPIEFATVAGRRFAILRDRVPIPAEFVPPYPIPAAWREFVGDYQVINPDAVYLVDLEHCRMEIANDRLLMDIRISGIENREVKVVIVPLNDHEGYVFGLGRNVGDVAYAIHDHGRLLTRYSGYLFEKIG